MAKHEEEEEEEVKFLKEEQISWTPYEEETQVPHKGF